MRGPMRRLTVACSGALTPGDSLLWLLVAGVLVGGGSFGAALQHVHLADVDVKCWRETRLLLQIHSSFC